MTAERYVATEALRQAICGREAEVLRALGIEWKKGAHHISCPYPDHADQNPSWRWDERKARAFCTCITQRGGHSILDIVKRMEGIEFDAAKLRVAEILGRSDLIHTKGQRMDAASLLQPPPRSARRRPREPLPRVSAGRATRCRTDAHHRRGRVA